MTIKSDCFPHPYSNIISILSCIFKLTQASNYGKSLGRVEVVPCRHNRTGPNFLLSHRTVVPEDLFLYPPAF